MTFSESLAQRIRDALARKKQIEEKRMFGGVGFLLKGNMLVGVWKNTLIVRVGPDGYEDALRPPHVKEFDITGRPMKGWIMVEPEGIENDDQLNDWLRRAADIRDCALGIGRFDIVVASAVLHHLRTDDEWRTVFQKLHDAIRPRGSFWIFDIVESPLAEIQAIHWRRYGEYLTAAGGDAFREELYERIIAEDTPRSVPFQLDLLRAVGFSEVELLHKNSCYAAFGAVKR